MTREFLPELPPHLPTRRDRTSLYSLYRKFDRLKEDYGWHKHLLFEQVILLKNRPPKLVPIFYYHTPRHGESIWLASGVHGLKEQAGPMAIAREIGIIAAIGRIIPMVIFPLLNANYLKNQRHPDPLGDRRSRQSVCDFDHLLPCKDRPDIPRKHHASNPYAEILGERFWQILKLFPCLIFLNLHEDFPWPREKDCWGKPHIYSDGPLGANDPVAIKTVEILTDAGVSLRMNRANGSTGNTRGGIATLYNGSWENYMAAEKIFRRGRWTNKPGTPVCIAIETPTMARGKRLPMEKRLAPLQTFIQKIPELLKTFRKKRKLYKKV